jgi:hypothetical protein
MAFKGVTKLCPKSWTVVTAVIPQEILLMVVHKVPDLIHVRDMEMKKRNRCFPDVREAGGKGRW